MRVHLYGARLGQVHAQQSGRDRRPVARDSALELAEGIIAPDAPRENLELFARLEGVDDPPGTAARFIELLELPDDGRLTTQLSAGNQQRLNLAVALLGRPEVLLLDEPTASLDPRQRRRLWDFASRVRERDGAVVFATQNLEELEHFATRVVVLLDGAVVFAGSLDEFRRAPEADVFA